MFHDYTGVFILYKYCPLFLGKDGLDVQFPSLTVGFHDEAIIGRLVQG